jgi:hypothetical protein
MTAHMFWIVLGVFVLGLFVGSNLGVMLMCLLRASEKSVAGSDELLPVMVDAEG